MPLSLRRGHVATYIGLQAVAVLGWWLFIILWPEARGLFRANAAAPGELMRFALADILILGPGGLLTASWVIRGHRAARGALCFLSGALAYATLYCIQASLQNGGGALAIALMVPATIATTACAAFTPRA